MTFYNYVRVVVIMGLNVFLFGILLPKLISVESSAVMLGFVSIALWIPLQFKMILDLIRDFNKEKEKKK